MSTNASNNYGNLRLPTSFSPNLSISQATNTTLTIGAGNFRDSTDSVNILCPAATLNAGQKGIANALDTGSLANSTWYYIHAITNSLNVGTLADQKGAYLLSTSATAPVLPTGYDTFRCVGCWLTDGSAHLLKIYKQGNFYQFDAPISVLAAGSATSYTAVDLSVAVPPSNFGKVKIHSAMTPAAAGDTATFRPTTATGDWMVHTGQVAAKVCDLQMEILPLVSASKPEMDYKLSTGSASLTLSVQGFDFIP